MSQRLAKKIVIIHEWCSYRARKILSHASRPLCALCLVRLTLLGTITEVGGNAGHFGRLGQMSTGLMKTMKISHHPCGESGDGNNASGKTLCHNERSM
jgi:hypothetical protein